MRPLFLVLICAISCGCREGKEPAATEPRTVTPKAAVKLTVLVVDDSELAQGIKLLAGEWSERSGGGLSVTERTFEDLLVAEQPAADVIVYPSRQLGEFVTRGWLRPVRPTVLADPDLAWSDFFTAIRDQIVRYGGEVYALPLGDSPLALAWTGSPPEKVPTTWEQFSELPVGVKRPGLPPFPLTREFIVRALAVTSPPDRATLFFDPQTMDARLTTPQLIRALDWLIASSKQSDNASANVKLPRDAGESILSPLLTAHENFTASLDRWEQIDHENPPVVLGFDGRLVSVTSSSRNAASAFKLIPWLTSGSAGTNLSQRSLNTLWCRASQVPKAANWFKNMPQDDRIRWLSQQLSRGDVYLLPRIPGIDRYLSELEATLANALEIQVSADQALAAAESQWNALTEELGRETQRVAFNRHLGLVE
jgi:ABC-type glycerol-3-phosphate transport system substrate-binding protein